MISPTRTRHPLTVGRFVFCRPESPDTTLKLVWTTTLDTTLFDS